MTRFFLPAGLLLGVVICMTPNSNPDLPWHLATGRRIVESRRVPTADFYSWTREGRPWIDFEWGSQVEFHLLEKAGGVPALWAFKVAAFACLMLPFVALMRLWGLPDAWAGLALLPLMLSFVPFLNLRPEIASFLFCPVELWLLEAVRLRALRPRAAALLAAQFALFAVWANLHAGFPMGLLACLAYAAGERLEGRRDWRWPALCAAAVLGTFANPYGPRIYAVFLDHARHAAVLRAHVVEWQLPNPGNLYQTPYFVLLMFCGFVFLLHRLEKREAPASHYLAGGLFALASMTSYRQTAYLSLVAFPLALKAAYPLRLPGRWDRWRPQALAIFFLLLANAGFHVLRLEGIFRGFAQTPDPQPVAACDFLRRRPELARLRMFNSWVWGGYLDYALHPPYKVFLDGRYLFTDYLPKIAGAASAPGSWRGFLKSEGVDLVVLDRRRAGFAWFPSRSKMWRPLDVTYMPREEWALIYWDSKAWIWVRRTALPRGLAPLEYRWIHPSDLGSLGERLRKHEVSRRAVAEEVWRYFRDAGDAAEGRLLTAWLVKRRGA